MVHSYIHYSKGCGGRNPWEDLGSWLYLVNAKIAYNTRILNFAAILCLCH